MALKDFSALQTVETRSTFRAASMLRPEWLFLAGRLGLGAVFLYAGVAKLLHPADFAKMIHNYQVLPDFTINLTAIILPWLETLLGLSLIAGVWLSGALLSVNALLAIFYASLIFNFSRGLNIHCGCFGFDTSEPPEMKWYLVRDGSLLLASLSLLLFHNRRNDSLSQRSR